MVRLQTTNPAIWRGFSVSGRLDWENPVAATKHGWRIPQGPRPSSGDWHPFHLRPQPSADQFAEQAARGRALTGVRRMSKFAEYVERVLAHEGGYVNHKKDPGGATNYGITQRVARAHGYMGDMRNLPRSTAIDIYRKDYWEAVKGDELPPAVAWQVFDAGVNHGVTRAIRWLQEAVGTRQDGIIGPMTLSAAKRQGEAAVVLAFNAVRLKFYASLATWPTFGKGWARRVAGNLDYAAGDL